MIPCEWSGKVREFCCDPGQTLYISIPFVLEKTYPQPVFFRLAALGILSDMTKVQLASVLSPYLQYNLKGLCIYCGAGRLAHIIFKLLHFDINNCAEVGESPGKFASKSQGKSGNFVRACEWEPCFIYKDSGTVSVY